MCAVPKHKAFSKSAAGNNGQYEPSFFFLTSSHVFHKKGCRCLQRSGDVKSAVYYEDAMKNRRPCAVCNPVPADGLRRGNDVRYIMLFDGTQSWVKNCNIVGRCHYHGHPGIISRGLLHKHSCLGKQCRHLEKFTDCVFWKELEAQQHEQAQEKEKRRAAAAEARAEEQFLQDLREEFQGYADSAQQYMHIVRVVKETERLYRVFYVSDNRFADGNRFPEFLQLFRLCRPEWKVMLRHIKDTDGHFVTVEEYRTRKRS